LPLPPEHCRATMRCRLAAPLKATSRRAQTSLCAPACALPIAWSGMSCTARGPGLRQSQCHGATWPGDRRKQDQEPEYRAKQEQHRRDLGETNRSKLKRRLIEIGTRTVRKAQLNFSLFSLYSSMPWQLLLYHRIIFRPLAPGTPGILKLKGNWLRSGWHAFRRRRIFGRF
jgi:hypothetical protein